MKIVIFYNSLDNIGGAEEVTLHLARALKADVITTNIDPEMVSKMGFSDVLPRIYSIGNVPRMSPFRQQSILFKFSRLDVSHLYTHFLITGDWAISATNKHGGAVWYTHSPLNELWQFRRMIASEIVSAWQKPIFLAWTNVNRYMTMHYAAKVRRVLANSQGTAQRLKEFYGIDGEVAFPPVDTRKYTHGESKGYWLSVNRLVRHKRIEAQLDAFRSMPGKRLVIVGSYEKGTRQFEEYRTEIESAKPDNVEIRSWVSEDELLGLYAGAVGVLATSPNEDFGMSAVEAMAAGKPFVAPDAGGYAESVIHGKTGWLYEPEEGLGNAVRKVEEMLDANPETFTQASIERAAAYDIGLFAERIRGALALERNLEQETDSSSFSCDAPLVSIIVPVRNGIGHLDAFLKSCSKQTYKNYELIIVDNTDDGDVVKRNLQNNSPFSAISELRIIREGKPGRGRARKAGELASKGELILMTDIDCILPEDWIKQMTEPLLKGEADAVQGTEHAANPGNFWSDQYTLRAEDKAVRHKAEKDSGTIQGSIDTKNFAVKRSLLKQIGFTNGKYPSGNDTSLSIELSAASKREPVRIARVTASNVGHHNPRTFSEVCRKQVMRGFWTARITKDYTHLVDSGFRNDTAQTLRLFFKFPIHGTQAPEVGGREANSSPLYDIVAGLAWRIGIVLGQVRAALYN